MTSFEESLFALNQVSERDINPGLERMQVVLSALGHPEDKVPAIHIAGTNGKGSVASFLSQCLLQQGCRVGLYTSPHLISPRERIQIGFGTALEWISEADWVDAWQRVQEASHARAVCLSYFEAITAMAFDYFSRQSLDWVVLECGLGGRWDATNVVSAKCSILTNISLEHQEWLGDTENDIFLEKRAIIKSNQVVVSGIEQESLRLQLQELCREKDCVLLDGQDSEMSFNEVGLARFQRRNIHLSLLALQALQRPLEHVDLDCVLKDWKWPGRMEWLEKDLCLDGAHNVAAMKSLVEDIRHWSEPPVLLLGMLQDKNYQEAISEIMPFVKRVICVDGYSERECSAALLEKECLKYLSKVTKMTIKEAVLCMKNRSDIILVTGSLHLIGKFSSLYQDAKV